MYWHLRKKFYAYLRSRKQRYTYDRMITHTVHSRVWYGIFSWTMLGAVFFFNLFVRLHPITGEKIALTPTDVHLWDLGDNRDFDVLKLRGFTWITANPKAKVEDD